MAEAIRMPRMSDTMTEGVIVEWHKKVGDKVKPGDLLAEVETDKATMELESYNEGTLLFIGVEKGKSVPVDGILAVVGKDGEDYKPVLDEATKNAPSQSSSNNKSAEKAPAKAEEKQNKETEKSNSSAENKSSKASPKGGDLGAALPEGAKVIRMPLLSDTMTEGKIVQWNKKVGDAVKADDAIAEVETDKATMDVTGYEEGTLLYIGVEEGKAAKVNDIIAIVGKAGTNVSAFVAAESSGAAKGDVPLGSEKAEKTENAEQVLSTSKISQQPVATEGPVESEKNENGRIKASPLAKKLAAEKGIDISKINGSGDGGRIIKKDIDTYVPSEKPATKEEARKEGPQKTVQPFAQTGQEGHTDIQLTQMRKTIARRLSESNFTAPHFFLTMEINMDNAITSRVTINEVSPVKISFNDMVIKACAMALRQHPAVNSSWMGEFIRQNHHIHIGSAIALPEGLIVPVIRFADQKSLSQIASDAKELYDKARNKRIQPQDFTGNTFTVSNLGMMDIEEFTAIINPPDSAILAVGRIREIVVKKGEGFATSNVMKVTLSCDHRSVDGAGGAAFLQTVKKFLENPVTMLV
ncbi:MAG: pyruvate dehydrogenase complex dihydrolipoamide acetyltransferase [Ginsengibacter sp.]